MPKITYRRQNDADPESTQVGPHRFEHGKAVEVDDATYERLSKNPWFKGGGKAKDEAQERVMGGGMVPGPDSGIDSSVVPAYAPGQGMKYAPETAMTADGLKPSDSLTDADLADNATTVEDPKEARKAGRVANKGDR